MPAPTRNLPVEVELALDVMPCQAMRRSYDGVAGPHPCAHFAQWGAFHSFDYDESGAPPGPGIVQDSRYAGKRPLVPEILSGCRKSPILAVGINPNLPGWTQSSRNAIHPYFEDYLQYAHYFRWRATDKLRIPRGEYRDMLAGRQDGPFDATALVEPGTDISVELAPVTMYEGYQSLLDRLAERVGWTDHKLAVGEDIAYANMVACGSARWTTRPVGGDPPMPVMGEEGARGIVKECFHDRKYFLRQMLQSLPKVVVVFSQTTANAYVLAMQNHFTLGDPRPGEPIADLLEREIRIRFGNAADGEELDARVVFSPHASARPDEFDQARERIVDHLVAEVDSGNLRLNPATGHLARPRGDCLFCENSLYSIGPCDYRAELRPLENAAIVPLAEGGPRSGQGDRETHLRLLDEFTAADATGGPPRTAGSIMPLDAAAPSAPRMVVKGRVVTMDGVVLDRGAVYMFQGRVMAVLDADAPAPAGFETALTIDTQGVIYPGLADLHNHLAYNILSLWAPPQPTTNRAQWLRMADYRRNVGAVMEIVARRQDLLKALIRYVEVKLILGGVTAGQGMHSKYRSGDRFFGGLVRNFEVSDDPDLPNASHVVPDLQNRPDKLDDFRRILDRGMPFFFHLAEGTDDRARAQFTLLADNNFVEQVLIGIHSLGLQTEDYAALAAAGAKVVWSPFSNSILYGKTIDLAVLQASGVPFALGSDWTPSGSRNILQEMKVAALTAEAQNVPLSAEQLARIVTRDAYRIAGWGDKLGHIRQGSYSDLTVLDQIDPDPFENLLKATERNVRLVVIAGHARYGDRALMEAAGVDSARAEAIEIAGRDRLLWLEHPSSPINHVSFAAARDALAAALADLPKARDATAFEPFDDASAIEIELDMQPPEPEWDEIEPLAAVTAPNSVPLDAPTIVDDPSYWERFDAIAHLPAHLKGADGLRKFYS